MAHVDALSRGPVGEPTDMDTEHVLDVLHVDEIRDWIATVQEDDSEIKRMTNIFEDDKTKFVADSEWTGERFNRTISDALSAKCHDGNDNIWDEFIGEVQLGINTTVNKTTGKSPSELLFGCRLMNAAENLLADVITDTTERIEGDALDRLRSEARKRIEKQQEYAKKQFDKHRTCQRQYNVGDLVRIKRTVIDKDHVGKSHKLIPKFQGPYRILKILPNDRFLIEDTPLTKRGNKRYENVVALDKIYPWMNYKGYSSDNSDSDQSESSEIRESEI
ncbi:uncharacterized protein LOC135194311 [Vanessa tameamea]|uniref:Uncharacterized protein LOC135194311 n=1 Tax=Vanessa tameamea TaxID=334116 RepID=A0ABM4AWK8_VANTA